jgi:hypothetical protein
MERQERDADYCASQWVDPWRRTFQYREPSAGKSEGATSIVVLQGMLRSEVAETGRLAYFHPFDTSPFHHSISLSSDY